MCPNRDILLRIKQKCSTEWSETLYMPNRFSKIKWL